MSGRSRIPHGRAARLPPISLTRQAWPFGWELSHELMPVVAGDPNQDKKLLELLFQELNLLLKKNTDHSLDVKLSEKLGAFMDQSRVIAKKYEKMLPSLHESIMSRVKEVEDGSSPLAKYVNVDADIARRRARIAKRTQERRASQYSNHSNDDPLGESNGPLIKRGKRGSIAIDDIAGDATLGVRRNVPTGSPLEAARDRRRSLKGVSAEADDYAAMLLNAVEASAKAGDKKKGSGKSGRKTKLTRKTRPKGGGGEGSDADASDASDGSAAESKKAKLKADADEHVRRVIAERGGRCATGGCEGTVVAGQPFCAQHLGDLDVTRVGEKKGGDDEAKGTSGGGGMDADFQEWKRQQQAKKKAAKKEKGGGGDGSETERSDTGEDTESTTSKGGKKKKKGKVKKRTATKTKASDGPASPTGGEGKGGADEAADGDAKGKGAKGMIAVVYASAQLKAGVARKKAKRAADAEAGKGDGAKGGGKTEDVQVQKVEGRKKPSLLAAARTVAMMERMKKDRPPCFVCKQACLLTEDCLTAMGKEWHLKCFACSKCGEVVEDDVFVVCKESGMPNHPGCVNIAALVCDVCGEKIVGDMRVASGGAAKYHRECWDKRGEKKADAPVANNGGEVATAADEDLFDEEGGEEV